MSEIKSFILATFFLSLTISGYAVREGGGGNGIVCFDSSVVATDVRIDYKREIPNSYLKNITSIEIIDLFKASRLKPIGGSFYPLMK